MAATATAALTRAIAAGNLPAAKAAHASLAALPRGALSGADIKALCEAANDDSRPIPKRLQLAHLALDTIARALREGGPDSAAWRAASGAQGDFVGVLAVGITKVQIGRTNASSWEAARRTPPFVAAGEAGALALAASLGGCGGARCGALARRARAVYASCRAPTAAGPNPLYTGPYSSPRRQAPTASCVTRPQPRSRDTRLPLNRSAAAGVAKRLAQMCSFIG